MDTFVRGYRNKLRENSYFTCYHLESNPQLIIPFKQYTTTVIIHCLLWPTVSALFFIGFAFLLYYDPCYLGIKSRKHKTNLRRVSPRILSKGRDGYKSAKTYEDTVALRPVTHPVQHAEKRRKRNRPREGSNPPARHSGALIQIDRDREEKTHDAEHQNETERMKRRKDAEIQKPRRYSRQDKSHQSRRRSSSRSVTEDSSGSERKRNRNKTSSSETSENVQRKVVRPKLKRTTSAPTRTPSFLRETNL